MLKNPQSARQETPDGSLEEEMATHSSILAKRIPEKHWESGRLQSTWLQSQTRLSIWAQNWMGKLQEADNAGRKGNKTMT